jgi:anti-sigma factor RsiW
MDHDLAIKNNAAERYLLGELTEVEIEEYEEHFFSCTACAQEVKLGSEFIDHAREVFKTDFRAELKPVAKMSTAWGRFWNSMRQPAPAFAVFALAVVSGFSVYQNAVIRELKQPEIITSEAVFRSARAEANWVVQARRDAAVHIAFEIPVAEFTSYEVDVLNESGASKLSKPMYVSAEQAIDTIDMRVAPGVLEAGKYTLVIQGVNSNTGKSQAKAEVARYPFEVQFQN